MDNTENDKYFYSNKDEYGWLSNFERSKQTINGIVYPTNEHYYQSQKTCSTEIHDWIAKAPNPYLAMKTGRSLREKELNRDWEKLKFIIMKKGLLAKFSQNEVLKKKLLDTGSARLHEDSPTDLIWGVKGKDMLGKLLMEVRDELK